MKIIILVETSFFNEKFCLVLLGGNIFTSILFPNGKRELGRERVRELRGKRVVVVGNTAEKK